jgi:hypothetical protein
MMVLKTLLALSMAASIVSSPIGDFLSNSPLDHGPRPIVVVPSDSNPDPGDTITLTITMDQTWSTNTTVYLSSSDSTLVPVPSSIVVLSGRTNAYVNVLVGGLNRRSSGTKGKSTLVGVTASTADGSATGSVYVND